MKTFCALVVTFGFLGSSVAVCQTVWDADGQGYTIHAGNTMFRHRNPGYGAPSTHIRAGNTQFHNFNNGTQGTQIYTPTGRFDSWSNGQQGWSGQGYTPYENQYSNPYGGYGTYQRSRY